MYALYANELCVGDIAAILNLSQSAISHQLRILKDARLVASRREGKTVFYALDDDHVRAILATASNMSKRDKREGEHTWKSSS